MTSFADSERMMKRDRSPVNRDRLNPYFKQNTSLWSAPDFIAHLTPFMPRAAALARQARLRAERAAAELGQQPRPGLPEREHADLAVQWPALGLVLRVSGSVGSSGAIHPALTNARHDDA